MTTGERSEAVIAVVRRVLEEDVMLRLSAELRHSWVESRT
jgi:hypothetical protein